MTTEFLSRNLENGYVARNFWNSDDSLFFISLYRGSCADLERKMIDDLRHYRAPSIFQWIEEEPALLPIILLIIALVCDRVGWL